MRRPCSFPRRTSSASPRWNLARTSTWSYARWQHTGAPDLPLLVVGQPGWGGVDLSARARALGLVDGRVRELGRLSDPDVAVVLSRAAALLMPSRAEGFGLPVLEAMHLGVPVIASDAPALVEVAGGAAMHHPVGDANGLTEALRAVVEDAAVGARLRERGAAPCRRLQLGHCGATDLGAVPQPAVERSCRRR